MALIDTADAADPIQQGCITRHAGQRVGGIRRQGDQAAAPRNLCRLLDKARLRMLGMNLK